VTPATRHAVVEGLRTRVQVAGEGPPLLLIAGLWGQVRLWDDLLPHLGGFRTIAFDAPGIGDSQLPRRPYTIRRLARFAAAVLDAHGVDRAHVLGVSLGGAVAQQLARSFPARVDRMVLASTSHGALGVPGRPGALLRFARPTAYASMHDLERQAGAMFGGRLREHPELVHRWHFRPPRDIKAYAFRIAGTAGWTSLPWLQRLRTPTLVLHGDDDPIVPLVNGRMLAGLIPGARLYVVRGGGHLLLLDSARDVAPVITEFLGTAEPGPANGALVKAKSRYPRKPRSRRDS
jgi:pimeloyl-ACP methyl ester carboxylesterase